jgi:WD40 repeat protein
MAAGTACDASVIGGPSSSTGPAPGGSDVRPAWSTTHAGGPLSNLAISPDGQLLATSAGYAQSTSMTAQLWRAGGALVATLKGHTAPVTCLAWSPDATLVASGGRDGSVRLWDRSGRLARTLAGSDPVFSLAWSLDGRTLAVGTIQVRGASGQVMLPGTVRLWRSDGTLLQTLATQLVTGGKFLNLAWSPDGSLLAAGAVDYYVWRADGTQVGTLRQAGPPAWAMAWAPDGRTIAIGDESGGLVIVAPDGTSVHGPQFQGDVNALSYSPDGAWLAVGQNKRVSLVRPADPGMVVWSATPADQGTSVWSPDGHSVAIAATDGLAVFGANGSPEASLIGCPGIPTAFAWARSVIAAATDRSHLCMWIAPNG